MKNTAISGSNEEVWEDITRDHLELEHQLTAAQQDVIIQQLKSERVHSEEVRLHKFIAIDGHLIIIGKNPKKKTLWLFDPKSLKMRKLAI